jgi:RNA polymerase sigma-70 factor (ECF subfamily)
MNKEAAEVRPEDEVRDVRAARAGDLEAFERLYRLHHARIDRLARWLLASPDVADVVQEVFVRAWRKLDGFQERAAFGTWLHRLAVNVLLRARQGRGDWQARHAGEPVDAFAQTVATDPAVRLDLDRAIASLPGGARDVFVLFEVEGHSHGEIAELLDISAHTSRSQLHRARLLLRTHLKGGHHGV